MYVVIRISGMVDVKQKMAETLDRLRLRRKYAAVLLSENPNNDKILKRVRNFVAYGRITEENLIKLIELRGQKIDKKSKIDSKKISSEIGKKKLQRIFF